MSYNFLAERLGLVPDPRVRTYATPNMTQVIEHMGPVPGNRLKRDK